MRITDNGVDIFPDCRWKAKSFSLTGIKESIMVLGGELTMDTAPDKGTALTVSISVIAGNNKIVDNIGFDEGGRC